MPPDNVLVVVLDTVRKDHLGPYGATRATTPTLDSIAADATVCEEAVAPAPWTLPSHASLFTGLYPHQHGATQQRPYLDADTGTLAAALSASGYATGCFSSNAWITPYTRLTAGFDTHDNYFEVLPARWPDALAGVWKRLNTLDHRLAAKLVALGDRLHGRLAGAPRADSKTPTVIDDAIEFTERNDSWFTFLNLMDAHLPVHPPAEYAEAFAPGVDPDAVCQDATAYNAGARDISDAEFDDIRRLYDAAIHHMDAELGRLVAHLKRTDQWDDTLVVVLGDHGELHGEHGLFGHEFGLYDPLVNVPLVANLPGRAAGRETTQVELLDLYHTILDATDTTATTAGEPLDPRRSMLSDDYRAFPRGEYAFIEYARPRIELEQLERKASAAGVDINPDSRYYSRMRAARRPDVKYVRNERIPDEAYRLDHDSAETDNRADADDTAIRDAERALAAFERRADVPQTDGVERPVAGHNAAAQRRLERFGYR